MQSYDPLKPKFSKGLPENMTIMNFKNSHGLGFEGTWARPALS